MKTEEILKLWADTKLQINPEGDFSSKVMSRIYEYDRQRKKPLFDISWLVEIATSNPLAKAAMIMTAAMAGVLRVVFLMCTLLWC
jgi:hypothetical protein